MKKPLLLSSSIALLTGFAGNLPALGTQVLLSDDTTANRGVPRAFYHTQPTLGVAATKTGIGKLALIKFDLGALPENLPGEHVVKATLRLYCSSVKSPGLVDLAPVVAPWVEGSVNGANTPALGEPEVSGIAVRLGDKRRWISVDVTTLVRDWVDGSFPNHGIALLPQFTLGVGGVVAGFDSKENGATGHEPTLEIVLAGSGAPGPQGPAGPKGEPGVAGTKGDAGAFVFGVVWFRKCGVFAHLGVVPFDEFKLLFA